MEGVHCAVLAYDEIPSRRSVIPALPLLDPDVAGSRDQFANDLPRDVGEPHVSVGVKVRQERMVEAHQVQDGGVQVVDVDLVFNGRIAKLIGRP